MTLWGNFALYGANKQGTDCLMQSNPDSVELPRGVLMGRLGHIFTRREVP